MLKVSIDKEESTMTLSDGEKVVFIVPIETAELKYSYDDFYTEEPDILLNVDLRPDVFEIV